MSTGNASSANNSTRLTGNRKSTVASIVGGMRDERQQPPHQHQGGLSSNPIYGQQPYANDWIEEKARELNKIPAFPIPTEEQFKKSRKEPSKGGVKAILYRLFKRE